MSSGRSISLFLLVALLVTLAYVARPAATSEELDLEALAGCIGDSGAVFYGAWWCPFCKRQKQEFASHAWLLPYVECYAEGTRELLPVCEDEEIKSFPTWVFPDGSSQSGLITPGRLARLTDCQQ